MNCGIITGKFIADTSTDEITKKKRINELGKIEEVICIETSRDLTGLNVNEMSDAKAVRAYLVQYGQILTGEIPDQ